MEVTNPRMTFLKNNINNITKHLTNVMKKHIMQNMRNGIKNNRNQNPPPPKKGVYNLCSHLSKTIKEI